MPDVAVFETGTSSSARAGRATHPASTDDRPPSSGRPSTRPCPRSRATSASPSPGAPASWDAAVSAVVEVGRALGLRLEPRAAAHGPFHPGTHRRAAARRRRVGLAGELHPRVVAALGLPARTCAAEATSTPRRRGGGARAAARAADQPLPAGERRRRAGRRRRRARRRGRAGAARRARERCSRGCGCSTSSAGPQVGEGKRSLAYALRLRAPDRTLTDVEVLGARDAAVAVAADRTGAVLRGT
jgi:phenylalanyl-tRNA synthetase beta chain